MSILFVAQHDPAMLPGEPRLRAQYSERWGWVGSKRPNGLWRWRMRCRWSLISAFTTHCSHGLCTYIPVCIYHYFKNFSRAYVSLPFSLAIFYMQLHVQ